MSTLREINESVRSVSLSPSGTTSALAILGWVARLKAAAIWSNAADAENWGIANRAPSEALRLYKTAVGAGMSTDLGTYGGLPISQWIESARTTSAFYRLLGEALRRLPMQTRAVVMAGASASRVNEGEPIPLGDVTIQPVYLEPVKVSALTVQTNEMMRSVGTAGQVGLNKDLLSAIATKADEVFLDLVTSTGTASTASAGPTAVDAWHDVRTALLAVTTTGRRLYWICSPTVASRAAALCDTAGAPAFPTMGATSGELCGLPVIVSDGVASDELILLDAASVAADALAPTVDVSVEGDVMMSTTPVMGSDPVVGAALTSLWQNDLVSTRINAVIAAQVVLEGGMHVTTSVNWGG